MSDRPSEPIEAPHDEGVTGSRLVDDVAATIATVSGRPVAHQDIDQGAWVNGAIAAGVPADYAVMLRWHTGAIITGNGTTPIGDIEAITGRPATSFDAFAKRNAAVRTTSEEK